MDLIDFGPKKIIINQSQIKTAKSISDVIKGIQSNITPQNILDLKLLTNNIDYIKTTIELETEDRWHVRDSYSWMQECGRKIGIISEYIISLGVLLKAPFFTNKYGDNIELHDWDDVNYVTTKINDVLSVTGGSSKGSEIDILIVDKDETKWKMWGFSSKMRKIYGAKTINWGDIEIKQMDCLLRTGCNDIVFGAVIFDRNHLQNYKIKYKDVIIYDWADIKVIWQQVYAILQTSNFDCGVVNNAIRGEKLPLQPRYHQILAMEDAKKYYSNGGKFFLFDHICRSGKTITALKTSKEISAKNILLLTSFPCINEMEWADTINRFTEFGHWNVKNFSDRTGYFDSDKNNFVMVSFQHYKKPDDDGSCGLNKAIFAEIRDQKWDLVIVDEVHYGFETEKSQDIIEGLNFDKCLALSATPFVNYFRNTFDATNTHRWTIFDEAERAKIDPIYAESPKMHFLLYTPPKTLYEDYAKEFPFEDGITFTKLMRVKDDGEFFYKRDIEILIKYLVGDKDSRYKLKNSPFDHSRRQGEDIGNGVLIFVPNVASLRPLQKILLENPVVKSIYGDNIEYTYSDARASADLKNWLVKIANKGRFIILAVDQLTTGVTMAGVDTVILMNDGESPQELIQRMYRCRTATKTKKDAYVIDLNPARTFRMVFEYTATLAEVDNANQIDYFKKFFDCNPIVYNDGAVFVDIDTEMSQIFTDAGNRYFNYFGKLSLLKNDELCEESV